MLSEKTLRLKKILLLFLKRFRTLLKKVQDTYLLHVLTFRIFKVFNIMKKDDP